MNKQQLVDVMCEPVTKKKLGTGEMAIVDKNGKVISYVGQKYALVENERIFKPFIKKFGINQMESFVRYGSGKHFVAEFNTGRKFDFGNGDMIDERLVIQNSYNRTRSLRVMFGAFRMICTNGLYSGRAHFSCKRIHWGTIPVDEIVQSVFDIYDRNCFELWYKFRDRKTTLKEQVKAIERMELFDVRGIKKGADITGDNQFLNTSIRKQSIELLQQKESVDNCRNVWGAFNQVNQAIAKQLVGNSKLDKRILGNKSAENYLARYFNLN